MPAHIKWRLLEKRKEGSGCESYIATKTELTGTISQSIKK